VYVFHSLLYKFIKQLTLDHKNNGILIRQKCYFYFILCALKIVNFKLKDLHTIDKFFKLLQQLLLLLIDLYLLYGYVQ